VNLQVLHHIVAADELPADDLGQDVDLVVVYPAGG
jgi:hypothetical protein